MFIAMPRKSLARGGGIGNAITSKPSQAPAGCLRIPPLAFLGNAAIERSTSIQMQEERSATGLDPSVITQAAPAPRAAGNMEPLVEILGLKSFCLASTTDLLLGTKDFQSLRLP